MTMRNMFHTLLVSWSLILWGCDYVAQQGQDALVENLQTLQEWQWSLNEGKDILRYLQSSPAHHRVLESSDESPCEWGAVFSLKENDITYSLWPMPSYGVTKLFVELDWKMREYVFNYKPTEQFNTMITYWEWVIIYYPNVLNSHLNFLFWQQ